MKPKYEHRHAEDARIRAVNDGIASGEDRTPQRLAGVVPVRDVERGRDADERKREHGVGWEGGLPAPHSSGRLLRRVCHRPGQSGISRFLGNGRVWGRALTWIKFFQLLYRHSKAKAGAQLHLVPLEIDEIERTRASGYRAPDLHVPRRRDKISFAEGRVEGRADIERLPLKTVEAESLVVTKAAHFRADEDIRHHLHRERRANPERRFAQGLPRPAQPRLCRLRSEERRVG